MKILNFRKLEHKQIWIDGMMGMTWGFIATLVAGTIIGLIATGQDHDFAKLIERVKGMLYYICPFAIGVGVGSKMQLKPLQSIALGLTTFLIGQSQVVPSISTSGAISWPPEAININHLKATPGDVFGAFIGAVLGAYVFKTFVWKAWLDILIIPLLGIAMGLGGMLWITYLTSTILVITEWIIYNSANKVRWAGILLAPVIGTIMGLALSLPTSSAAIAYAIALKGDAATAAMAGTAAHMLSFGILTYFGTRNIGSAIAVGFGTSMLQMKNFSRRPQLLIIPCLVSAIAALTAVALLPLDFPARSVAAGMGTSGLAGQIFTLDVNGWTSGRAYLNVIFAQLLLPALLASAMAWLCTDYYPRIKREWLVL